MKALVFVAQPVTPTADVSAVDEIVGRKSHIRYHDRAASLPESFRSSTMLTIREECAADEQVDRLHALHSALGAEASCLVDEYVIIDGTPSSSTIKMVGTMVRADGLDRAAFGEHWVERHAPITLSYDPSFVRYVANVVTSSVGDACWDGVVEQWFPDLTALTTHVELATDGQRPLITVDIPRFVSEMQMFATERGES